MTMHWKPATILIPLNSIAVLIPAREPEPCLIDIAATLSASGVGLVLILDDGSSDATQPIFDALRSLNIRVVRHAVNLGKGRALKTGFNCILAEYPHLSGVVTADADGQHTVADILHVAAALASGGNKPVLGSRTFGREVPLRSRFGNVLTRYIFAFVTGNKLRDTQTGLRGIPKFLLPELMTLDGERYEYEMTVLAHLCREGNRPTEVPIATVYIENNRSSHFNPIRDSMRIYFVLARFFASSLIAAGIDYLGFSLAYAATHSLLTAVAVGRLSSLVNFTLNKRFVFRSASPLATTLWRYYALVLVVGCLSYGLIGVLYGYLGWNVYVAKVPIDLILSLVSFSIQRTFVFRRSESL
jgi:glycosyltransferase involved in cell wall biosynthesis